MEVLSGPLFALIFLIHNTFPNRERTDSDRALCMRCDNVHRPVSEWDFAFPLAHAQVSQCKRITLHKYAWISDWIDTTQELSWQAEADHTLFVTYTHCTLIQHTTCSTGEMAIHIYTAEALSDVMPWVHRCILLSCSRFYCSPSVTILPLSNLQWSLCGLSLSLLTFSICS